MVQSWPAIRVDSLASDLIRFAARPRRPKLLYREGFALLCIVEIDNLIDTLYWLKARTRIESIAYRIGNALEDPTAIATDRIDTMCF